VTQNIFLDVREALFSRDAHKIFLTCQHPIYSPLLIFSSLLPEYLGRYHNLYMLMQNH